MQCLTVRSKGAANRSNTRKHLIERITEDQLEVKITKSLKTLVKFVKINKIVTEKVTAIILDKSDIGKKANS